MIIGKKQTELALGGEKYDQINASAVAYHNDSDDDC